MKDTVATGQGSSGLTEEQERYLAVKKEELGLELNEAQQRAVAHGDGPLLLLASPGSGKTTTIMMRMGYLIEVLGVNPARMKAVTFSRAAARDMKERFDRFFPHLPSAGFSTIHSLAFEIIREQFRVEGTEFLIIEGEVSEEEDGGGSGEVGMDGMPLHKKLLLRSLFKRIAGENPSDDSMDELTTFISYVKNRMIPPDRWSSVRTSVPHAAKVLLEYEDYKRSGHRKLLLDYDDMLTYANDILEREEGLLRKVQRRYDYVLTDESQDTSLVQHAIIAKLVREHRNLCVVADDDQSIYSWRGAEPSYLLEFKSVYPDAVTLYMERNYRSSQEIVHAANAFIKRNRNRYNKNMFTANGERGDILFRELPDYRFQAKFLAQHVQEVEKLSEVAILYRNNASSIALMNEFDRMGIPFYMKDADVRFFSHWVVEDVLNFMRMSYTDKRPDLLERIHLKMSGYISKHQMAVLKEIDNGESVFDNLLKFVTLKDYQVKLLEEAKGTFQGMRGMPPQHAIRVIRSRLGYEKALDKMCERLGFKREYLIGILNTLEDIADGLETMEQFAARLKQLEAALKGSRSKRGQNAVTFSTFHSAKGLEFDRVYMIDLIDGVIPSSEDGKGSGPHKKDGGTGEQPLMEEAVRLFYVGMTRAREHLEMVTYRERDGESVKESAFVTAVRGIVKPEQERGGRIGGSSDRSARRTEAAGERGRGGAAGRAVPSARSGAVADDGSSSGVIVQERSGGANAPLHPNTIRKEAELVQGAKVRHRVFGTGVIERWDGERIWLQYPSGPKVLSLATCLSMGLLEGAY
ncbi:ATP-dependent helicase [Paenibacillus chungangensis]|uniref:DNA 3'-5' helicase n=1 Tax=Paenibacillus chungangensis TaxID=696535 RepID=A0ABW3HL49_9BACL